MVDVGTEGDEVELVILNDMDEVMIGESGVLLVAVPGGIVELLLVKG